MGWGAEMMNQLYWHGGANSLLFNKDVREIEAYAAGRQDMGKYKKMFKRLHKDAIRTNTQDNPAASLNVQDITGIDWEPLGFLTQPLYSALAVLQKMPIYVKCTAIDALAREKKERDYNFLKNRPFLDGELKSLSQKLGSIISPPTAAHNAEGVDISNFDLDPTQEDELNFYINLFYKLRPESAFEAVLMALAYVLDLKKVRDLEDADQFKYGCSVNRCVFSDITGLPSVKYIFPGNVFTPDSNLPDYSDTDFRFIKQELTATELMDQLGDEISEDEIGELFDEHFKGATGSRGAWTKEKDINAKRSATVPCVYMEFKSWDILKIHKKKNRGYMHTDIVPFDYQLKYSQREKEASLRGKPKEPTDADFLKRKAIQNTYTGYWFSFSPKTIYKYKKLEGSFREKGKESLSPFGINIWRSQDKSRVELAIPFVDGAQKASIKLQHAIIMSKPRGLYVDLKYLRNTFNSLKQTDYPMTFKALLTLLLENNVFLGDSEGVDPSEVLSGSRPFYDIQGGVGAEVEGYLMTIKDNIEKIARITGWNDALTGQTPTAEGLVGVQKLLLQSAINSLYDAQTAQKNQTEKVMKAWAHQCQWILKFRNSASAKALEAIMSSYKADVLADMHTIPAHQFGIMIENAPTEEQQADLNNVLIEMFKSSQIAPADYFTIRRIFNFKDAEQLLVIRQRKKKMEDDKIRREQQQAMLAGEGVKAQGKVQETQIKEQGRLKGIATQGQIQQWLAQYGGSIQLQIEQMQMQGKTGLQRERMQGALEKAQRTANTAQQAPIAGV